VLAHLRALQTKDNAQNRSRYKLELAKGLYGFGWTPENVKELLEVVGWLMQLLKELHQSFQEEMHAWEVEKNMPYITSFERHGIQKGLHQGLLKGIAAVLTAKFGKVDKRVLTKAQAIQSVEGLQALLDAIPGCTSIQEVRERLPDRPA
jgi:hypothetical protein